MVSKLISIVLLTCIGELVAMNITSSGDMTFLFFSNNFLIIFARLILALLIIVAMFDNLLRTRNLRYIFGTLGLFLLLIGSMGIFSNTIDYAWYPYLKIMDFMMLFLSGIVFCLYAIPANIEHNKASYKIISLRGFLRGFTKKEPLPRSRPAR